jgi:hypothetical protein
MAKDHRSGYPPLRATCFRLAKKWQISPNSLFSDLYSGPELVPFPEDWAPRVAKLEEIALLLDSLLPARLQWNFWFRSSIANRESPKCRLGWMDPDKLLSSLVEELRTLLSSGGGASQALEPEEMFSPVASIRTLDLGAGGIAVRRFKDPPSRPNGRASLEIPNPFPGQ